MNCWIIRKFFVMLATFSVTRFVRLSSYTTIVYINIIYIQSPTIQTQNKIINYLLKINNIEVYFYSLTHKNKTGEFFYNIRFFFNIFFEYLKQELLKIKYQMNSLKN